MAKTKLPTIAQTRWLRRIALSPMMVTRVEGQKTLYGLQNGVSIDSEVAERLIREGWVVPDRDGLPWFEERPQTYRVRSAQ